MCPSKDAKRNSTAGIEHIDSLYGYALVLTQNRADAEDLVQKTYVRAIRAMGRLRHDSNMKGWLFTILRNIWLNEVKQRRRATEFVDVEAEEMTSSLADGNTRSPHEVSVGKLEQRRVRAAIQQLPKQFREIILLREWEKLSYQEIAMVLDCPVGTLMSRLTRARSRLRDLLSSLPQSGHPHGAEMEATE
jgi:RNA polymerase sigma-70 factor, ECF subfamily